MSVLARLPHLLYNNYPSNKVYTKQIMQNSSQIAIKQLLQDILHQILQPAPMILKQGDLSSCIEYFEHKQYKIKQGLCYQQYSNNLCGYHALFNTYCFMKLITDVKCQYDIRNGAHFWLFKQEVKKFLIQLKNKQGYGEEWPWSVKNIQYGDFQRVYYQTCKQKWDKFSVVKNNPNIEYMSYTWRFQYNNLLLDADSLQQLTHKFNIFRNYKSQKPMVLHLILQITTHWLTFFAVNRSGNVQYWFFDSQNDMYLNYDWQQIVEYIENASTEQVMIFGRKQFTKFQKESNCRCVRDIQKSLKLIINCLEGNQTLENYQYHQRCKIFARPLQRALATNQEQVKKVISEYSLDITQFFLEEIQWTALNKQNKACLVFISESLQKIKDANEECHFLYQLTRYGYIGNLQ